MTADAEVWIDLLLKRGPELRKAGVLSIGCEGFSAVLAPPGPDDDGDDKTKKTGTDAADEPSNAWENPASYPTGNVPTIDVDKELPAIPEFDS